MTRWPYSDWSRLWVPPLMYALVAALHMWLSGCSDVQGAPAAEVAPDAIDDAAIIQLQTGEGLPWGALRELQRLRVELLPLDEVRSKCRRPGSGIHACVDYVPVEPLDSHDNYPLAVVWDEGPVDELIVHEAGHLLWRHMRGTWNHGHCSAYFAALGEECER